MGPRSCSSPMRKLPFEVFGRSAAEHVASRLSDADVSLRTGADADRVVDGRLHLKSGEELDPAAVVALPALRVPAVPGLPRRNGGFVQTDVTVRASGLEDVWAAGDATWSPVKQGGLAAQQADAAARGIAAPHPAPTSRWSRFNPCCEPRFDRRRSPRVSSRLSAQPRPDGGERRSRAVVAARKGRG